MRAMKVSQMKAIKDFLDTPTVDQHVVKLATMVNSFNLQKLQDYDLLFVLLESIYTK